MGFNSGFKGLNGGLSCYQLRKYYFAGGWRRLGTQSNVVDTVNWKISLAELRINSLETTTCFHETRSNCKYLRSKCVNPCNDRKETKIKDSVEITNKMQPCIRIYYSTVHWRLSMFRAAYGSSSGALTVSAASGLHTHVVTGRSQVWVPLETCWAFNERWNNKFCYKVASCWLFLLNDIPSLQTKTLNFITLSNKLSMQKFIVVTVYTVLLVGG